jgi:hypothetical protein
LINLSSCTKHSYYYSILHDVNMDNHQEKLLKQIKSLSDSIRRKSRSLKLGISEREHMLESTFKPVTEPLKQLVKSIGKPATQLDGDVILPISKYERDDETETSEYPQDSEESEDGEKSEESEEEREEGVKPEEELEEVLREKESGDLGKSEEYEDLAINPSNLSKLGTDIMFKGPLGRQYLLKMLHSSQANRKYHTYGARIDENGLMIGDNKIDVDKDDNILIGDNKYKGTKGLFELIFKNNPSKYTKKDLNLFKTILENTNAHRKGYSKNSPVHRNRSIKYESIISILFPSQQAKAQIKRRALSSAEINILHKKRKTTEPTSSGKGLMKNLYKTNIIYYNDINQLVDRMRLLHEAREAGQTGLDNEWVALIDELRTRGVIVY